jgi:hypothetical protein
MTETYTISFPLTTCAICGDRDWRHVSVLGAKGAYCHQCSVVAMVGAADNRLRPTMQLRDDDVVAVTQRPLWEPPKADVKP